jgi:hypothetical protein
MIDAFAAGGNSRPRMHLIGFPRVSLAAIDQALTAGNGSWTGRLPYEIVVTGTFP